MSATEFTSGQAELAYIQSEANRLGLEPKAVLAVAAHEGVSLPAEVGDSGTSFGPWQMHAGGDLPQSIWQQGAGFAQAWANSPAGITYALEGIKGKVGTATSGPSEIASQVYNFERPQDPAGETAASIQTYQSGDGPIILSAQAVKNLGGQPPLTGGQGVYDPTTGQPIPVEGAGQSYVQLANKATGFLSGPLKEIWQLVSLYYLRVLEVIAGGLLVIVSLFMLARGGVPSPV